MPSLQDISRLLPQAMGADRFRLRKRLDAIRQKADDGKPFHPELLRLDDDLNRSIDLRDTRQQSLPKIVYDESLPVCARRDDIARAIRGHQVVVISGETGSGKSTQLPKICLELGRGIDRLIGHTQPRRIAARSIASRIADELGTPLGRQVGFKMRFSDTTSPRTLIKLMTDGILLAETQSDRFLDQYDTIILDEAHERSLNVDFLIGLLKGLIRRRRDLKVIITSATLDAKRFAAHFPTSSGPAPVIEVSGRMYPVETRYHPLLVETRDGGSDADEPDMIDGVVAAVDELARQGPGDMLIFMPSERDIHETAKALRRRPMRGDPDGRLTRILPLYARLSAGEQQKVFQPYGHRRIVIATNVAESSLTVPGIRYVIDPGTARISRYSPRSKTQRLPIEPVSQASADQRQGRCGRIGPGICIRLYTEADYLARDRYTTPEIQRTNLASVILQTKSLRLGDVERFPFLDPPKPAAVRDGFNTLHELGALDESRALTGLGRRLSRLPVDPRIGRMILAATEEGCLAELLIIASVLEIQDPRDRPFDKRQSADEAHAQFVDERSDFLTFLKLWDFHHALKEKLSRNQLRRACAQNFLSYNRMREWVDIHRQLVRLATETRLPMNRRRDEYDPIHRAILTGLLSNVAMKGERFEYTAAGGGKFHVWPGSSQFGKAPPWIVAAEMVQTTRNYLRVCARIEPEWIEPLAPHLVKSTFSDPRWDQASGSARADERVTLFGLPVVPRRSVQLGPIDPEKSRELLIQHGLVEGQLDINAPFFLHNRQTQQQAEQLQEKLRRHDLLLGEWAQYDFYNDRIPAEVYDVVRLNRWREEVERDNPQFLWMTEADFLEQPVDDATHEDFPDTVAAASNELPLDYAFRPGEATDGVTICVPLEMLNQLDADRLAWLVPGLLEPKIIALIRSLPKPVRRALVPAPDTARKVLGQLRFGEGSLVGQLAELLGRQAGVAIGVDMFRVEKLPDELRMNVRVTDREGTPLAEGRELNTLRQQLGEQAAESIARIDDTQWYRDGLTDWDFDELPERVELRRGGAILSAYPMLVDAGETVSMRLADSPLAAERDTRRALRRLFLHVAGGELRTQVQWLPKLSEIRLHSATIPGLDVVEAITELVAERALSDDEPLPRTRDAFEHRLATARARIGLAVQEVTRTTADLFAGYHQARLALERTTNPIFRHAVEDVSTQLAELIVPGFLTTTPWRWLARYPCYFRAIAHRLERLAAGSLARDREQTEEIVARWQEYVTRLGAHRAASIVDPALVEHRWLLEEYRVSLFAQKLGTAVRISAKRLESHWETVREDGRVARVKRDPPFGR